MRALAGIAAGLALALPAPAAAQESPSLRLFAGDRNARVSSDDLDITLDVGLWVASTHGEFRIRATRPGYGPWQGAQVDAATGAPLRTLPRSLLDGEHGLPRFVEMRFFNSRGRLAARRTLGFCPSSSQRVNGDGPAAPTYLPTCGTTFPFTRGAVWGIDTGWAGAVRGGFELGQPPLGLRPGRYTVHAAIRPGYRRLFAIPDGDATARLKVRVVRRRGRGLPRPGLPLFGTAMRPFSAPLVQEPDPATLPDLVALPPWEVSVRARRGRELLLFAGSPWNAGPGPLVVEGFRRSSRDSMGAVQYFVDAAGEVTGSAPAGSMEYHAARGHEHWHFLQLVTYRILRPSGGEVVRSRKQSFCLVATDAVDLTVPGAQLVPEFLGLASSTCGEQSSIWLRQALPAGWGDTYGPFLPGQRFDITGVPNGRYILEMRVNPFGQLSETTTANNVASRRIALRGKPGRRRVRVAPWHGIRDGNTPDLPR